MSRALFIGAIVVGVLLGPTAFAGQLNSLGQWVPTSTEEGWEEWGGITTTEREAHSARRTRQASAGYVSAQPQIRYRIDALGRQVPVQTNHP